MIIIQYKYNSSHVIAPDTFCQPFLTMTKTGWSASINLGYIDFEKKHKGNFRVRVRKLSVYLRSSITYTDGLWRRTTCLLRAVHMGTQIKDCLDRTASILPYIASIARQVGCDNS